MASIKCILKSNYTSGKGNLIAIRVIIDRKKYEYGIDIHEFPHNFDETSGRVRKHNDPGPLSWKDKNYIIEREITLGNAIFYRYQIHGLPLTMDKFKTELKKGSSGANFIEFIERELIEIEKNRTLAPATIESHKDTLAKLKEFRSEILFSDLNYELLHKMDQWLTGNYDLAQNTKWKFFKNLKKFINEARHMNLLMDDNCNLFKIKKVPGTRIFLSQTELQKLISLYHRNILPDHYQATLRRYLFSFYACGLRYSDTEQASWKFVDNGQLIIIPQKTKRFRKPIVITLHESAFQYIENQTGNFFVSRSDTTLNEHLKEISRLAGIKKHVTFHTARHTFATWYLEKGGKLEVLQHLLGHSKIEDTMVYVHITESRKRDSLQIFDKLLLDIIALNEGSSNSF